LEKGLETGFLYDINGGVQLRIKWIVAFVAAAVLLSFAAGTALAAESKKAQEKTVDPVALLTKAMTERLSSSLNVKHVVGDPVKVGKTTIIPLVMIDVGFGGGGGGPQGAQQQMGGKGYGMSGEARPIGFVVISEAGVKFVTVGKVPRK
jgi:uncharacterized spore protein YtfJ